MTTKRRTLYRGGRSRISPEVIASWQAADYSALHAALDLTPWNFSPLPTEVISLGVHQGDPPDYLDAHQRQDWRKAQAMQRQLLKVAGWPDCRQTYRDNLAEALQWQRYCKLLIDHPERGPAPGSTGADPVSRRQAVEEAEADVAYRRGLLADLGEPS
jgi:hypothetical protein